MYEYLLILSRIASIYDPDILTFLFTHERNIKQSKINKRETPLFQNSYVLIVLIALLCILDWPAVTYYKEFLISVKSIQKTELRYLKAMM